MTSSDNSAPLRLLLLDGDGISSEIMEVACEVLESVNRSYDLGLAMNLESVGLDALDRCGLTITDATIVLHAHYGEVRLDHLQKSMIPWEDLC